MCTDFHVQPAGLQGAEFKLAAEETWATCLASGARFKGTMPELLGRAARSPLLVVDERKSG